MSFHRCMSTHTFCPDMTAVNPMISFLPPLVPNLLLNPLDSAVFPFNLFLLHWNPHWELQVLVTYEALWAQFREGLPRQVSHSTSNTSHVIS